MKMSVPPTPNSTSSSTQMHNLNDVMVFKGVDKKAEKLCFLSHSNTDCNIMHMPITEVDVPNVPSVWKLPTGDSNCIQLECEHCFHASALVIHFMTHNMTCPVCRDGFNSLLDPKSLPVEVRSGFVDQAQAIQQRFQVEEARLLVHVNMNFENIMRDWSLLAHVNQNDRNLYPFDVVRDVTLVTSRLRLPVRSQAEACLNALETFRDNTNTECIDTIINDTSFIPVFVQNNFIRHMNILYRRDCLMEANFHLHHPMLGFTFATVMPVSIENIVMDGAPTMFKALVHDGLIVGYFCNRNSHLNSETTLLCHAETQCIMLWLRIDLMTQCVINQIQDHLQDQLPNNFSVSSQNQDYSSRDTIGH